MDFVETFLVLQHETEVIADFGRVTKKVEVRNYTQEPLRVYFERANREFNEEPLVLLPCARVCMETKTTRVKVVKANGGTACILGVFGND